MAIFLRELFSCAGCEEKTNDLRVCFLESAALQPKPIRASQTAASVANPSTQTCTDPASQAEIRPRTLVFRSRIIFLVNDSGTPALLKHFCSVRSHDSPNSTI